MNYNTLPPLFILILNLFYIWPVGTASSPSDMSHYSLSTFWFTGMRCFRFTWYLPCPWNQPFLQGILSLQWHLFSQRRRKWDHQRRVRTGKIVSEVQAEGRSHLSLKWEERPGWLCCLSKRELIYVSYICHYICKKSTHSLKSPFYLLFKQKKEVGRYHLHLQALGPSLWNTSLSPARLIHPSRPGSLVSSSVKSQGPPRSPLGSTIHQKGPQNSAKLLHSWFHLLQRKDVH